MSFIFIYTICRKQFSIIKLKKEEEEKSLLGAHPGIDPGPLVSKSDGLNTRPRGQIARGPKQPSYWTHNPSSGHIHIGIHGINLIIEYCLIFSDLFISIWYLTHPCSPKCTRISCNESAFNDSKLNIYTYMKT